jgi:shikimate dehydrogenase
VARVTERHRAAVLGHPITHSLSPVLHRAAYRDLGLDWQYEAVDVTVEQLDQYVQTRGPEWAGLSLTMPLKEAVQPLLDVVDPVAASVRAVNTVIFSQDERRGYNTDIAGMKSVLDANGVSEGSDILLLGAGATARSTVAALATREAIPRSVRVSARRREAAAEVVNLGNGLGLSVTAEQPWPPTSELFGNGVVISTLPSDGAAHVIPAVERAGANVAGQLLIDVSYDPWPTPLGAAWRAGGGRAVGGLDLLVGQAVEQVELMTGRRPSVDALRRAGEEVLRHRQQREGRGIAQEEQ